MPVLPKAFPVCRPPRFRFFRPQGQVLGFLLLLACLVGLGQAPLPAYGAETSSDKNRFQELDYTIKQWQALARQNPHVTVPAGLEQAVIERSILANRLSLASVAKAKEEAALEVSATAQKPIIDAATGVAVANQAMDAALAYLEDQKSLLEAWQARHRWDKDVVDTVARNNAFDAGGKAQLKDLQNEVQARLDKINGEVRAVREKQAAIRNVKRHLSTAMTAAGIVDKVQEGDATGAVQDVIGLGKEYAGKDAKNRLDIASGGLDTAQKMLSGDLLGATDAALGLLDGQIPDYTKDIADTEGLINRLQGSMIPDAALQKQARVMQGKAKARLDRIGKVQGVKNMVGTAKKTLSRVQTAIRFAGKAKEFLDVMGGRFPTSPGKSQATARLVGGMKLTGEAVKELVGWLPPVLKETMGQILEAYADALIAGPAILERMSLMFANEECENNKGWSTGSVAEKTFNSTYNACMKFTPEFKRNVSLYVNSRILDDYPDYVFVPDMGKAPQILDKQTYKRLADIAAAYTGYATILAEGFVMNDETVAAILQAIKTGSPTFTVNDGWFFDSTITIKDIEEDTAILLELRSALGEQLTKDNARDMIKRWKSYLSSYSHVKRYCQLPLFDSAITRQRYFVMWLENPQKLQDVVERQMLFAERETPECKAAFTIQGPTRADAGQTVTLRIVPNKDSALLRETMRQGKATWFKDGARVGQGWQLHYRPNEGGKARFRAAVVLNTTLGPRAYKTGEHVVAVAAADTPAGNETPGQTPSTAPAEDDTAAQTQEGTPTPEPEPSDSAILPTQAGSSTTQGGVRDTGGTNRTGFATTQVGGRDTGGTNRIGTPTTQAGGGDGDQGKHTRTDATTTRGATGTAATDGNKQSDKGQTGKSPTTATGQTTPSSSETSSATTGSGDDRAVTSPTTGQQVVDTTSQAGTATDACAFLEGLPDYLKQMREAHTAVYDKLAKACIARDKDHRQCSGKGNCVKVVSTEDEDINPCGDACFASYMKKHAASLQEIYQVQREAEDALSQWKNTSDTAKRQAAVAMCRNIWQSRKSFYAQYPKPFEVKETDACGDTASSATKGVDAPTVPVGLDTPATGDAKTQTPTTTQEETPKKATIVLRQVSGGANVKLGGTIGLRATVTVDGKPAGKNVVLHWEPLGNDGVRFSKPEGPGQTGNQATFLRPGTVHVWVTALAKDGGSLSTIGKSNQVTVVVQNPGLALTASPDSPLVGQEVAVALHESPALPDDAFSLSWDITGPSQTAGATSKKRGYSFLAGGVEPITVTAQAKSRPYGEDLGQARVTVTARPYKVTVKTVLPPGGSVPPHRDVTLQSAIAPTPPGAVNALRYAWQLGPGCRAYNTITRDIRAQRSEAGTCTATVTVRDAHDIVLGSGSGSFTVVEAATPKEDKETQRLLNNAQKQWINGEEQAACEAATQALQRDASKADAKAATVKYCDKGAVPIGQALKTASQHMADQRFDEAQRAIETAKRINPRSQNVRRKEQELAEQRRRSQALAADKAAKDKAVTQAIVQGAEQCRQRQWGACIQTLDRAVKDAPTDFAATHPAIMQKVRKLQTSAKDKLAQQAQQEQRNKAGLAELTRGANLCKKQQWQACIASVDKAMAQIDPALVKAKPDLFTRIKQMRSQAVAMVDRQQQQHENNRPTPTTSRSADCARIYDKGYAAYKGQDFKGAARWFQAAIDCDPNNAHYQKSLDSARKKDLFQQAQQAANKGDHRGAIRDYERVLKMRPNDCGAMHNLGASLLRLGKNAEALAWINRARQCDPGNKLFQHNAQLVSKHIATQKAQQSQSVQSANTVRQTQATASAQKIVAGNYAGSIQGPATGSISFRVASNGHVQGTVRGTYLRHYNYTGGFSGAVGQSGAFSCQLRGSAAGQAFTGQIRGNVANGAASGTWKAQSGSNAPTGSWRANHR